MKIARTVLNGESGSNAADLHNTLILYGRKRKKALPVCIVWKCKICCGMSHLISCFLNNYMLLSKYTIYLNNAKAFSEL